jgi:hypothetical protein
LGLGEGLGGHQARQCEREQLMFAGPHGVSSFRGRTATF